MNITQLIQLLQKSNVTMIIVPGRNRVLITLDSQIVKNLGLEFYASDIVESEILNAISEIKSKHP